MTRRREARSRSTASPLRPGGAPALLTDDTPAKRLADRLLPQGVGRWIFFALVAIGIGTGSQLPERPGLLVDAIATIAAAAYCVVNFWRCREAHCVVTGTGWTALAAFELFEVAIGHSLINGGEQLPFLAVFAAAFCFEAWWRRRHGTKALLTAARKSLPLDRVVEG